MNTSSRNSLAALGSLVLGALGTVALGGPGCDGGPVETGAARQAPGVANPKMYYRFKDGILREANGATGPCNSRGGCRVPEGDLLLGMLGFEDEEQEKIDEEARQGRVVFYGRITIAPIVVFPGDPPHPVDGPVEGSLSVDEVWRSPQVPHGDATIYRVQMPLTLGAAPAVQPPSIVATMQPYLATAINGAEGTMFTDMIGVRPVHKADAVNRNGLLVQGAFEGVDPVRKLRAAAYYRRWEPEAEFACDKDCGGFGACMRCNWEWQCTDACLGHACPATECGIPPAIPDQICADGTVVGARCQPGENDACGWVVTTCPAQ